MRIRDALESDAETLAAEIGRPRGVVIDMIHDRSVRVAIPDDDTDPVAETDDGDPVSETDDTDPATEADDGDPAAEADDTDPATEADHADGDDGSAVTGFVAFDVRGETVHVTDFDGDEPTVRRLFEEPRRFASREGMNVEVVIPDDESASTLVEAAGFEAVGGGPRFEGRETTRYRIDADDLNAGS